MMDQRPEFLSQGARSTMFPVAAESSKESRAVSIFLSCLEHVSEYGKEILTEAGAKVNSRSTIETWTEVVLKKSGQKQLRPDGLIVVKNGDQIWTALVEAKISTAELTADQVEGYLEIAKLNGIDAVVTISNQYAPYPSHYPIVISPSAAKKAKLHHWSWVYLLAKAEVALAKGLIRDSVRSQVLRQLSMFLANTGSGVQGFELMPQAWGDLVSMVQSRSPVNPRSPEVQDTVAAWYQQTQDMCSILAREHSDWVSLRIPKAHAADAFERQRHDVASFCDTHSLQALFNVPGAPAPVKVTADFDKRTIYYSVELSAPKDRKSTKARITWLLRQLEYSKPEQVFIRLLWPGKAPYTQFTLASLRKDPELAEQAGKTVNRFEVIYQRDLGARFGQRKSFISEVQAHFPIFYYEIGKCLKAWQAPKRRANKDVDTDKIDNLNAEEATVSDTVDNQIQADTFYEQETNAENSLPEPCHRDLIQDDHTDDQKRVLQHLIAGIEDGVLPPINPVTAEKLKQFRLPPLIKALANMARSSRPGQDSDRA